MALLPSQVILYAADPVDYQIAMGAAAAADIPMSQIVGSFYDAWNFVSSGRYNVIAVGGPALFALYYNPCGWGNPAGGAGGSTPFALAAAPSATLPGANRFVNAAGSNRQKTLRLAVAFAYYAVQGIYPEEYGQPPYAVSPLNLCVGSPAVTVPNLGYLWGVDSAAAVNATFYQCVQVTYGRPAFWGRYLTAVPGVNDGLSSTEVALLHQQKTRVLVIYNGFGGSATGYSNGHNAANNASAYARDTLHVPSGVSIFADIEGGYPIDSAWIEGWCDSMAASGYVPGLYENPLGKGSQFESAYCAALSSDSNVSLALLWSNEPEPGVRPQQSAPAWAPRVSGCNVKTAVWQYGEGGGLCGPAFPVDTDLAVAGIASQLW